MNLIATDLQRVPSKGSQSASPGAAARYALLEVILEEKVAKADWVPDGKLMARDLPGRGRFLSEDLEQFLQNSVRKHKPVTNAADVSLRQVSLACEVSGPISK